MLGLKLVYVTVRYVLYNSFQCKRRRCENVLLRLTPMLLRYQHTTLEILQNLNVGDIYEAASSA